MAFDEAFKADSIAFDSGSSKLPESSATLIGRMAEIAATCPQARIEITGHTDSSGNAAGNLRLSDQRAGAVEAALIVKGVEARRLTAKGFGSARPIATNDTPDAKARNRRIEVIVRP
jgi:OOP family OmpA-OmpF porin